jgi:hypothetical protein
MFERIVNTTLTRIQNTGEYVDSKLNELGDLISTIILMWIVLIGIVFLAACSYFFWTTVFKWSREYIAGYRTDSRNPSNRSGTVTNQNPSARATSTPNDNRARHDYAVSFADNNQTHTYSDQNDSVISSASSGHRIHFRFPEDSGIDTTARSTAGTTEIVRPVATHGHVGAQQTADSGGTSTLGNGSTTSNSSAVQSLSKSKLKTPMPPTYKLGDNIADWYEKFMYYAALGEPRTVTEIKNLVAAFMDADASKMCSRLLGNFANYDELRTRLLDIFSPVSVTNSDLTLKFYARNQYEDETYASFFNDLCEWSEKAFKREADYDAVNDKRMRKRFLDGMVDEAVKKEAESLVRQRFGDNATAQNVYSIVIEVAKNTRSSSQLTKIYNTCTDYNVTTKGDNNKGSCNAIASQAGADKNPQNRFSEERRKSVICYNCGYPGHIARFCPTLTDPAGGYRRQQQFTQNEPRYQQQQQYYPYQQQAPQYQQQSQQYPHQPQQYQQQQQTYQQRGILQPSYDNSRSITPPPATLTKQASGDSKQVKSTCAIRSRMNVENGIISTASIKNVAVNFLVDTGSSVSLINSKTLDRIRAFEPTKIIPSNCIIKSCSIEGELNIVGCIEASFRHGDFCSIREKFYVANDLEHECIVGMDILLSWPKMRSAIELMTGACNVEYKPNQQPIEQVQDTIQRVNNVNKMLGSYLMQPSILIEKRSTIKNYSNFFKLNRKTETSAVNSVCAISAGKKSPIVFDELENEAVDIEILAETDDNNEIANQGLVDFSQTQKREYINEYNVRAVRAIEKRNSSGKYSIVYNISKSNAKVKSSTLADTVEAMKVREDGKLINISTCNVSDDQGKKKLTKSEIIEKIVVDEFPDLIATKNDPVGVIDRCEHKIDLIEGARPFKERVRQIPIHFKEEFDKNLQTMIDRGIIRKSESPFASPTVLVRKKTGDLRICIDYRKLNEITQKDSFPLPLINELVHDRLGGMFEFSSFDLADGYYQIPIKNEDRFKTAFITDRGLFEFNVMPFGLTSAPATFQRFMNEVLVEERNKICTVYLDDILVHSRTFEEHQEHVRTILSRLRDAKLKLRLAKCNMGKTSIEYL